MKQPAVSANIKNGIDYPLQKRLRGPAGNRNAAILTASQNIRRIPGEIHDVVSIRGPAGEKVYARVPHELHSIRAVRVRYADTHVLDAFKLICKEGNLGPVRRVRWAKLIERRIGRENRYTFVARPGLPVQLREANLQPHRGKDEAFAVAGDIQLGIIALAGGNLPQAFAVDADLPDV